MIIPILCMDRGHHRTKWPNNEEVVPIWVQNARDNVKLATVGFDCGSKAGLTQYECVFVCHLLKNRYADCHFA